MLTAPGLASIRCVQKAGMTFDDLDLIEVNEAFASVVLKFLRDTGVDWGKCNVNGGAIALGHPLGATGTRLLLTLVRELEQSGKALGCASACIGGGQGIAMILERC
jgi:acetyl-CoA C-acetyltransferase